MTMAKQLTSDLRAATRRLAMSTRFELVPTKALDHALIDLPPAARVTVTCLPKVGIDGTLAATARLLDAGHHAVPHLAARLVRGPQHTAEIARWLRDHAVSEVFVIAGDAPTPVGRYEGALPFIRDLFEHQPGVRRVGIPAYPDGHPLIGRDELSDALHAKQDLLAELGVEPTATTQMCFDPGRIGEWLRAERSAGMTMPVLLGVAGVVDRKRLMTMGVRLGVGTSLRYLNKHRTTMRRLLAPGRYDATTLVEAVANDAEALDIAGLHTFTFNGIGESVAWHHALTDAPSGDVSGCGTEP